jgi:hypothetical protein
MALWGFCDNSKYTWSRALRRTNLPAYRATHVFFPVGWPAPFAKGQQHNWRVHSVLAPAAVPPVVPNGEWAITVPISTARGKR